MGGWGDRGIEFCQGVKESRSRTSRHPGERRDPVRSANRKLQTANRLLQTANCKPQTDYFTT
jgi:hypothetical protein